MSMHHTAILVVSGTYLLVSLLYFLVRLDTSTDALDDLADHVKHVPLKTTIASH